MRFELKGGHVLAILLGFFGVTIAVNAALAMYAIETFSGEDVSKPYLKGLEYNKTLAAHAAQTALGWSAEIEVERNVPDAIVTVRVFGRERAPKNGLAVTAELRRPTNAHLDRSVALEAAGDGVYRAKAKDLAAGQWDVIARTSSEDGTAFEAVRRVVLK